MNETEPPSPDELGAASDPTDPDMAPADDPGGGTTDIFSRLFDGSIPGPPVEQLQADYGLGKPESIGLRGCMRVAGGDGVPPIFEMVFGGALFVLQQRDGPTVADREGERDSEGETPEFDNDGWDTRA